jgi:hypothetical protein
MTKWYLEGFDRETEWLVREHPLPNLDAGTIRRVLKVYDDYPIEPFVRLPYPELGSVIARFPHFWDPF